MVLDLPIELERRRILDTIYRPGLNLEDRVTIISGGTGIGKSTGIPLFILDETDDCLIVTEPTQLAAMTIPQRVAELYGCELGHEVGYHHAGERLEGRRTRCLFQTDGVAFVQHLRPRASRYKTLMIDEAHKFSLNIELLIGLVRDNPELRIIISSATIDTEETSIHFGGAPVIEIPGRMYGVEVRTPGESMEHDVVGLLAQGPGVVLGFQYGEEPIYSLLQKAEALARHRGIDAVFLPLHSSLSPSQQRRCFERYDRPVFICATDYAETSVTIPGVTAVVDSELYNRMEVHNGVPGLYPSWTSLAQRSQRMGRAGRQMRGIYIGRCPLPDDQRDKFIEPEINRSRLDGHLLKLKAAGKEIRNLRLVHPAPIEAVEFSERALTERQCLTSRGAVSDLGKKVAALPISVANGCLIIASHELGVLDDGIAVASILEQGGIRLHRRALGSRLETPSDTRSDVICELETFRRGLGLAPEALEANGISSRAFRRATSSIEQIAKALARFPSIKPGTTGERKALLKAITLGQIENVFFYNGRDLEIGQFRRGFKGSSTVRCTRGDWVVGEPSDRRVLGTNQYQMNRSLALVSIIDPRWLPEIAGHLVTKGEPELEYDPKRDAVVAKVTLHFRGHPLYRESQEVTGGDDAARLFAAWIAGEIMKRANGSKNSSQRHRGWGRRSAAPEDEGQVQLTGSLKGAVDSLVGHIRKARELNLRAGIVVFPVWDEKSLSTELQKTLGGASRLSEVENLGAIELPAIDDSLVGQIEAANPRSIDIGSRRGLAIEYKVDGLPVVQVSDWWPSLPDDGVQLPGGRAVAFEIFGALGPSTDVRRLKQEAAITFPVRGQRDADFA